MKIDPLFMKAYPGLQLICFHTFTPVIGNELYQSLGDPQGVPAIKGVGKHVLHDVMCLLLLHQREVTCCRGQTGDVTFFFFMFLSIALISGVIVLIYGVIFS